MTAEFATVVPAVVLLLSVCLATLQLGVQQLRVQDAAAVAARVEARGEGSAASYVAGLVPGASLSMSSRHGLVCASVADSVSIVGLRLGGLQVRGESCAPSGGPGASG